MIKTFESERVKEYTSSRELKKNNGERDMGKIDEVRLGFETAYIDGSVVSNNIYRPEFVSNNHKAGKKVFSSIEDEKRGYRSKSSNLVVLRYPLLGLYGF